MMGISPHYFNINTETREASGEHSHKLHRCTCHCCRRFPKPKWTLTPIDLNGKWMGFPWKADKKQTSAFPPSLLFCLLPSQAPVLSPYVSRDVLLQVTFCLCLWIFSMFLACSVKVLDFIGMAMHEIICFQISNVTNWHQKNKLLALKLVTCMKLKPFWLLHSYRSSLTYFWSK